MTCDVRIVDEKGITGLACNETLCLKKMLRNNILILRPGSRLCGSCKSDERIVEQNNRLGITPSTPMLRDKAD